MQVQVHYAHVCVGTLYVLFGHACAPVGVSV